MNNYCKGPSIRKCFDGTLNACIDCNLGLPLYCSLEGRWCLPARIRVVDYNGTRWPVMDQFLSRVTGDAAKHCHYTGVEF